MTEAQAIVFVLDDEAAMRDVLQSLIRSVDLRVATFASAREFLTSHRPDAPDAALYDAHRRSGTCVDPRTLGLVQTRNGIWLRALDHPGRPT